MGMTEDDKRNCCLVEIQETEAKYYKTLEDIEKVSVCCCTFPPDLSVLMYVHLYPGPSNVVSEFPFVTSSLLASQACGPGRSMEMSAIGSFIGEHKCHRSRSIQLLLAQPPQETPIPGALGIDTQIARRKDIYVNAHTVNKS